MNLRNPVWLIEQTWEWETASLACIAENLWVSGGAQLLAGTLAFHALTLHHVLFLYGPSMTCMGQAGGVQGTGHQHPPPGTPSAGTPIRWGPCGNCFSWLFLPRVTDFRRGFGTVPCGCPGCDVWAKAEVWGPGVEEHHPYTWWETPDPLPLLAMSWYLTVRDSFQPWLWELI